MALALALYMLRHLKVRRAQKIGLSGVFSLGIVIIIVDIARTANSPRPGAFAQTSLFRMIESSMAVIVSCLPTYRALLATEKPSKPQDYVQLSSLVSTNAGTRQSNNTMDKDLEASAESYTATNRDHYEYRLVIPPKEDCPQSGLITSRTAPEAAHTKSSAIVVPRRGSTPNSKYQQIPSRASR